MKENWQTVAKLMLDMTIRKKTHPLYTTITMPSREPFWIFDEYAGKEKTHFTPDYIGSDSFGSLSTSDRARLLEGNWNYNTEYYSGGRIAGKTVYLAACIKNEVKPPYRYEFIPGKHLTIIGRDDKKYILLIQRQEFPQQLVNILES